jgi:uncharacterized integral membrane protein (TIGR00697 family)
MNEALLLLIALVSVAFVFTSWRLGKERLYSAIIVFLILIATVGGKTADFFGHTTNTGNIFYASVFLATYFLIERYGKLEGLRSIWIGIISVVFFTFLVYLSIALIGSPQTASLNSALSAAFNPVTRIALASLVAYFFSQTVNVYTYTFFKERWKGAHLWLRANIANAIAQVVDSIIFFTIAFAGTVDRMDVLGILATGFLLKVIYMMCATPLLYLNKMEEEEAGHTTTIVMH